MRALTQYQVYDADTNEVIKNFVVKADAVDRVDFEFTHGRVWATMRTITVKHFNNTIYHTEEAISC